ncbi:hypothetical protein BC940DRAFT_303448 [Gongronella butleri]|nr:hypothetical protein BC940DRAFT_303448 [Gongronella butleri]
MPHTIYHERKNSPSSFEDIDPYRQHTHPQEPDEQSHSRTTSDSSTSRLLGAHYRQSLTLYGDDPYTRQSARVAAAAAQQQAAALSSSTPTSARSSMDVTLPLPQDQLQVLPPSVPPRPASAHLHHQKQPSDSSTSTQRANSYLPYSHHNMDAEAAVKRPAAAPIYVEDEQSTTFQGSILQDHFMVDTSSQHNDRDPPSRAQATLEKELESNTLDSQLLARRRRRASPIRYCGIQLRVWIASIVTFVIAITLLLYFLVPRSPRDLQFNDLQVNDMSWSEGNTVATGSWRVNITINNEANWIPLKLNYLNLFIADSDTGDIFGFGQTNTSQTLAPRSHPKITDIPLHHRRDNQRFVQRLRPDLRFQWPNLWKHKPYAKHHGPRRPTHPGHRPYHPPRHKSPRQRHLPVLKRCKNKRGTTFSSCKASPAAQYPLIPLSLVVFFHCNETHFHPMPLFFFHPRDK